MIKKIKKANALIKKNNLIKFIKNKGITSISPDSIPQIEDYITEDLDNLIDALKQELFINGKKTLNKKDILNVLDKIKNKENNWEI